MIKSVQKAMNILSVISNEKNKPVRIMHIAERLSENTSTITHIIKTLEQDGYVERVSHNEGYILGPSAYYLTRYGKYDDDLVTLSRPVMKYVHKKTDETVILAVIQNNTKFIIDYIDAEKAFFSDPSSIRRGDIYRTATGRLMLAHMDMRELRKIYDKNGAPLKEHWDGINTFEDLAAGLSKINKKGILRLETPEKNCSCAYAAPIFKNSKCIASIGVACKKQDDKILINPEKDKLIKQTLTKAANEIIRRLKYS